MMRPLQSWMKPVLQETLRLVGDYTDDLRICPSRDIDQLFFYYSWARVTVVRRVSNGYTVIVIRGNHRRQTVHTSLRGAALETSVSLTRPRSTPKAP